MLDSYACVAQKPKADKPAKDGTPDKEEDPGKDNAASKVKWAGGWCAAGIEVEILDNLYTGAKGSVLELLNEDEAVVLLHGLSEVLTFDITKLKSLAPKLE